MIRWIWQDDFWRGYVCGAVVMFILSAVVLLSSFALIGA